MTRIWDAHNHWMPPQVAEKTAFFKKGWSDSDSLLKTLDDNGIEKAVLLYPSSDAHINMGGYSKLSVLYNNGIAKKVKEKPDRLIGAGILPIDKPDEMLKEVERIKELGLSCLSLASSYDGRYLDDKLFIPVLEKAEKQNLPIFVHSQIMNPIGFDRIKDPLLMPVVEYVFDITMCAGKLMMSDILSRLKDLKIVFSHFAGVLPFLVDRFDSTYAMLKMRNIIKDLGSAPSDILKNIYVDTSGVKSKAMLEMALEFFGPSRVIWGSDYPAKRDPKPGLDAINCLSLDQKDKEAITGSNLINIFKEGI